MTRILHLILATYLLAFSGIPSQEMHELFGIKAMTAHFHEHEEQHEHEDAAHGMNFLDFLYLHYADETHKNSEGHENLPFHHNHQGVVVNYFISPATSLVPKPATASLAVKSPVFFESRFLSPFVYSIWQPPKF
jgi:hypothetical protein